jgi:signal transduction histidine kinase
MFSSLRARLWLSYAFLIVTALGVVAIVLILFLLRDPLVYRQIAVRLKAAEGVLASQPQPADHLQTVAQALNVRAVLYNANGAIIKDSDPTIAPIALPTRVFLPRVFSIERDTAGKVWLYDLTPLSDGTWLLVAAQRPKVAPLLAILTDDLSAPLLEGGLIALLLALVLALVIARWIADPLERVIAAARLLPTQPAIPVSVDGPREVQELTQAFNAMAARVIATQTSQRDFVANVSHELKTPLTSIQGFAQALMDGTADTPEARHQAAEQSRARPAACIVWRWTCLTWRGSMQARRRSGCRQLT